MPVPLMLRSTARPRNLRSSLITALEPRNSRNQQKGTSAWRLVGAWGSGYNIARMRYEIILAAEAVDDLKNLTAHVRAEVCDAMERHLRHEPTKVSRSRIKRLRGLSRPQYRLRVGDEIRVFYDVREEVVEVLAVVPKSEADQWLGRYGESDETRGSV